MSQCKALWYPFQTSPADNSVGLYCVLNATHKGPHMDDRGLTFTDAQAHQWPVKTLPSEGTEPR